MTAAVGIALVGAGPWGLTLGKAAARLPNVDLRWICELDPTRRAQAAEIAPGARLTAALDEALDDGAVAAALVAVDSPRHHAVGLRVLTADRHLLVEKPLAMTVAHAAELSALADRRNRVLSVGHLLLHHPAVRRARELIADGHLGEALWIETTRQAPGPARVAGSVWWTLAPHDISLALHLFDAVPVVVSAVGGAHRRLGHPASSGSVEDQPPSGACRAPDSGADHAAGVAPPDDNVVWATLRFADGRLAHVHVARLAPQKRRGFQVIGSRRALSFDELSGGLRLHDPAGVGGPEVVAVDATDALVAQCLHFVSSVARNDARAGNGAHALAVVRVLEAGARSMREGGAPVEVA